MGPRLCFSFLPRSGLAPGLGKAEPAGEGHRQVGQSSRDGDRKPDFSRPRVTWEAKTRDFYRKGLWQGTFQVPKRTHRKGRKTLKYCDRNIVTDVMFFLGLAWVEKRFYAINRIS